jgi:hypothetical protein
MDNSSLIKKIEMLQMLSDAGMNDRMIAPMVGEVMQSYYQPKEPKPDDVMNLMFMRKEAMASNDPQMLAYVENLEKKLGMSSNSSTSSSNSMMDPTALTQKSNDSAYDQMMLSMADGSTEPDNQQRIQNTLGLADPREGGYSAYKSKYDSMIDNEMMLDKVPSFLRTPVKNNINYVMDPILRNIPGINKIYDSPLGKINQEYLTPAEYKSYYQPRQ